LADILDAIAAIRAHLGRGELSDGLVYDTVRVRLIEIGEAAKSIPAEVVATESGTPWRDIAGMRDRLAHRYFDTLHSIVQSTAENDPSSRAGRPSPPGQDRDKRCLVISGPSVAVTDWPQAVSSGQRREATDTAQP
jgi:uncharacterized protein with HEPN domain